MVYQWKLDGLYKTSVQDAGKELERIASSGELTSARIVEESRDERAVLHSCFEWDDLTAAEEYRKKQAGDLIRNIVTIEINDKPVSPVRAFVSIRSEREYKPIKAVIQNRNYLDELLESAISEMNCFQTKYMHIEELQDVVQSMERTISTIGRRAVPHAVPAQ